MKKRLQAICFLLWVVVAVSSEPNLERAAELYQATQYEEAVRLLEAAKEKTAPTFALLGKCYYRLEQYKKATEALEKAVAGQPDNSSYVNWLGKAYGRRAETSSLFTAPAYAAKARKNFERAVELDGNNIEAIEDLFEYYLEAPGLLGGGVEKAVALSERVQQRVPAKYHAMQARIAEKEKQFRQAEQHLRRAAELAPSEAGRLASLAKFLARQGRYAESEQLFERAQGLAPTDPQIKFERAKTYLETHRNRQQAQRLLQEYLTAPLTPENSPRSEARRLLEEATRG